MGVSSESDFFHGVCLRGQIVPQQRESYNGVGNFYLPNCAALMRVPAYLGGDAGDRMLPSVAPAAVRCVRYAQLNKVKANVH